ncbi:MAG: adenylyltransferase/cytidyltransferase family protein [Candidatus Hydrogenedentes bacterium]|nr:adenylyltransferase/cytidyltransferase family protein [Candidatus Hydrogenedentota bacterium]
MKDYSGLLSRFKDARILVVGDIYLDENVRGVVTGISLEAPIPVYEVHQRKYNPGAAGNAACNAASLGAKTYMVGYVGNDFNAQIVREEFAKRNVDTSHLVVHPTRATNTYGKLRAGGHNIPTQEILRTDTPRPVFLENDVEQQIIANINAVAPQVDAIIVVDQVSSVATEGVLAAVVAAAKEHKLLTVGDSRSRAGKFKGFDIVVPNDREAGIGTGIDVIDYESLQQAAKALLKIAKNALVTRGVDGITVFSENGEEITVPVTINSRDVVDVTGAGDTVTAAVTLSVLGGGSLEDAATIGNLAAGVAVVQEGVVTVSNAEVVKAMQGKGAPAKQKTMDEVAGIVKRLKEEGKSVVWTNGCFDILHVGHVTYLMKAASLGDVLVVGLNSDASVRKVKGPDRPIVSEQDRVLVMSALECVSYITVFSEPNTVGILKKLEPDVYAKGGDYKMDTLNQEERLLVEGYGGRIAIIPGVDGQSTSAIIQRIIQAQKTET